MRDLYEKKLLTQTVGLDDKHFHSFTVEYEKLENASERGMYMKTKYPTIFIAALIQS